MVMGIAQGAAAMSQYSLTLAAGVSILDKAMQADSSVIDILLRGLEQSTRAMMASVEGIVSQSIDIYA
jgi:hypothetical protein